MGSLPRANSFGDISKVLIFLCLIVIVPVVAVILLNELAPLFFTNLAGLVETLTNSTTGSVIGDAILAIFIIVIPIVAVAFFGTLAIDAMKSARGSGGGGV